MARFQILAALLLVLLSTVNAFLSPKVRTSIPTAVWVTTEEDTQSTTPKPFVNRGVSINQDGESNVWAIEPRVELETKSSEEKSKGAIIAAGGLLAFGAVAALVLTNLPDPSQF